MSAKEKYLDELNTSFQKYFETKSLYSYKRFKAKCNEGKKLRLSIGGYDTGYMNINEFSVLDLDPVFAPQIKDLKRIYSFWVKVLRSHEDEQLKSELYNLHKQLLDDLLTKSGRKFRNGKYVLEKSNGRVYLQWGNLLRESYVQLQRTKKKKPQKIKKDKFSYIRKWVKNYKNRKHEKITIYIKQKHS